MKDLCWIAAAVVVIAIALQFHEPEEKPKKQFEKNYDQISMQQRVSTGEKDSPKPTSIHEFEEFL